MMNERAVLVPGELRGYRQWVPACVRLSNAPRKSMNYIATGELRSVAREYTWLASNQKAFCLDRGDLYFHGLVPELFCTCGIYALLEPIPYSREDFFISGVIAGSGKVLIGSKGFRAERARILALTIPSDIVRIGKLTIDFYPNDFKNQYPDVKMYDDYSLMIHDYPPEDISRLTSTT